MDPQADNEMAIAELLASYLPNTLVRRFRDLASLPIEPVADHFEGALLFADITGFTALSGMLIETSRGRVERVTRVLNAYFEPLLNIIAEHGGEVMRFAGDAVIVLWSTDRFSEPLSSVTLRAAQCGLAIQKAMHNRLVEDEIRLSMRICIGAGIVEHNLVGGVASQWENVIAGSPMEQVSQSRPQPGEVAISAQGWARVHESCSGAHQSDGTWLLHGVTRPVEPRPQPPVEVCPGQGKVLRSFVPEPLRNLVDRLTDGDEGFEAELREVTILFVHLPELGSRSILAHVHKAISSLQVITSYNHGVIDKAFADEKGGTLLAAWGLPPGIEANTTILAIQAAMAMKGTLLGLGNRCSFGIATGEVYCGSVGIPSRREYTLIGPALNLASRLMMDAEDGDVLCDEHAFLKARSEMVFQGPQWRALKGIPHLVAAYRPMEATPRRVQERTLLVGREDERRVIEHCLKELVTDKGRLLIKTGVARITSTPYLMRRCRLLVFQGEAGVGKSRLVDYVEEQALGQDVTFLRGHGSEHERFSPYHAWQDVFRRILQQSAIQNPTERPQGPIWNELLTDPEYSSLTPLLSAVLPIDLEDNPITAAFPPEVRADNTRRILLHVLDRFAEAVSKGLIVAMEDGHWMDSASWDLLQQAHRHVASVLFIVSTRAFTPPTPPEFLKLVSQPTTNHLIVTGLSSDESLQLARSILRIQVLPDRVRQILERNASGNPFFIEILLHELKERFIRVEDGVCHVMGNLEEFHPPPVLADYINGRLNQLPHQLTNVLRVAGVIGPNFTLALLNDIFPFEKEKPRLLVNLRQLEDLHFIQLDVSAPETTFRFKNSPYQEQAYKLNIWEDREKLHFEVAIWYERHYTELSPYYALLAHHYTVAQVADRAIWYLEKAGEQALGRGGYREGVSYYQSIIELDDRARTQSVPLLRARWESQLGEALGGLGDQAQRRIHLKNSLRLLDHPISEGWAWVLWAIIGQFLARWKRRPRTPLTAESNDPLLQMSADCLIRISQSYYFSCRPLLTLLTSTYALNVAEESRSRHELAFALANYCLCVALLLRHRTAEAYAHMALKATDASQRLDARAWVLMVTGGLYRIGRGQWGPAHAALEQASETYQRLLDMRRWAEATALLGWVYYHKGDFLPCSTILETVWRSARFRGDPQNMSWGLLGQVGAQLHMGETGQLSTQIRRIQDMLEEAHGLSEVETQWAHAALARCHLRLDHKDEALLCARNSLKAAHSIHIPMTVYSFEGYAGAAEVLLDLWEMGYSSADTPAAQIRLMARKGCGKLASFAFFFASAEPRSSLCKGRLAWLAAGRCTRSTRRHWRRALEVARQLEMPLEEGLALHEIGRHLPEGDPQRARTLDQALGIFHRIGARHHEDAVQRLLGGAPRREISGPTIP